MARRPRTRSWPSRVPSGPHFLLHELMHEARRKGAPVPYSANTPYLNTIPPDREAPHPGDRAIEHRIRSYIRWNALAIVLRANKESSELGGHIASFQSSALLYDTGFMHFWHAPTEGHGGDLVYVQGHCSPGIYARSFIEGRLSEERLLKFRQEVDGKGLSSYPHPWLMPDYWQFPTVSMGLGPADGDLPGALPQVPARPRPRRHRQPQGLGVPRRRRVRRAREPGRDLAGRARAARQPGLRHQLQPAAPRRPGARQRQDHPGAGGDLPRRRLERDQGPVGLGLGQADRRRHHRHPAQAHGGGGRRRVPGLQVEERRLRPRALLRQVPRARSHGRRLVRRRDLGPGPRRARPVQGLRRLPRRPAPQGPAHRHPRQDRQGLRHGRGRRGAEHHPSAEEDGRDPPARLRRALRPAADRRADRTTIPFLRFEEGSPGARVPARPAQGAGRLPAVAAAEVGRARGAAAVGVRGPARADRATARSRPRWRSCGSSTRSCATRRSASTWCRSCPTNRAPSAWRACSASSASSARWASSTGRRTPTS